MPTLLIVAVAAVVAIAGLVWMLGGTRRSPLDEVDRWSHAREVTTRWAEDPDSAPAPVKRMAQQMSESRARAAAGATATTAASAVEAEQV